MSTTDRLTRLRAKLDEMEKVCAEATDKQWISDLRSSTWLPALVAYARERVNVAAEWFTLRGGLADFDGTSRADYIRDVCDLLESELSSLERALGLTSESSQRLEVGRG